MIPLVRADRFARLLGVLALAWACTGATTLPDRGSQADQEACTPDVFRLCSDYVPDEPQILACLKTKRQQLSPACAAVIGPAETERSRRRRVR